ncbi:MAG TPA: hypothetical protein VK658_05830 [Chryseolinea sp.]|nr:hypothetical protein [Chryseolinea sp.]
MHNSSLNHAAIDLGKIRQKKVRKFISNYGLHSTSGFTRMQAAGCSASDASSYHQHHKKFIVRQRPDLVWDAYMKIHPRDAWTGDMVSFGVQYCTRRNCVNYFQDECTGIEEGQIIILNLRLLWGALNIAVAHQIAEVNHSEMMFKLCYMVGGASAGSQWITLKPTAEGFTEVHHDTLYKSNSNFRDTKLYPLLHTKAITEFHASVKRKAENFIGAIAV